MQQGGCVYTHAMPKPLRSIAIAFFLLVYTSSGFAEAQRPNIILIVTDDQGWADIGYHNEEVRTPNMDKLAGMGVELDAHYVQPQCTPTRVALLTGRYPSRYGPNATRASNDPAFPKGTLTMASMLKDLGYDTALMGKWHLGSTLAHAPKHFGFDYSYGSLAGAVGNYDHRYRLNTPYAITWHRNGEIIEGYENGTHTTDLIADEAVKFIEQDRDKPFFLYLPFLAVHTPLVEKDKKWHEMNKHVVDPDRRLFLAAASHLDHAIGKIMNAVENSAAIENTVVIFMSDNGGVHTGYRGGNYPKPDPKLKQGYSSNKPLRGGKTQAYEGGIRVPAFVVWPGTLKPGKVGARMHAIDWMPTLANLLGHVNDESPRWDGEDIWPFLTGEKKAYDQPRTIYTTWNNRKWESLHHGDLKIVRSKGKPWELYDLAVDPNETTDLAKERPNDVAALGKIYQQQKEIEVSK